MYLPGFPAIARDLHTTAAKVSLSLSGYFIGIALGQLLYGPLLDRFGRKPPLYVEIGVPTLRSFNVKPGYIVMTDLVSMSEEDNNKQAKSRLFLGDVVSVRTGYLRTTVVISQDIAGCNCIDLVITKVNEDVLMPKFLTDWTNSIFGMRQIFAKQGGNAQQHFNVGEMKKMLVPDVSIHEQRRVTSTT